MKMAKKIHETKTNLTYLCGSLFGGLVVLLDVGGLALLLYIDQRATRLICDISNAFNVSARMQSGLCGPDIKIVIINH